MSLRNLPFKGELFICNCLSYFSITFFRFLLGRDPFALVGDTKDGSKPKRIVVERIIVKYPSKDSRLKLFAWKRVRCIHPLFYQEPVIRHHYSHEKSWMKSGTRMP